MQTQVNRYSQEELEEFRQLIQKNLDSAQAQLDKLDAQIIEISEDDDDHGMDMMDDSSTSSQLEMLTTMRNRQKKHIGDLENALVRIRNKSYGICIITGELIDKRRLFAVLTTTKSLAGKVIEATPPEKRPKPTPKTTAPTSFTRIIKKATPPLPKVEIEDFDDDDDDDEFDDLDDYDNDRMVEMDDIVDPDSLS